LKPVTLGLLVAAPWIAIVLAHRFHLHHSWSGIGLVTVGVVLPFVWVAVFLPCGALTVFALTALVFGFILLAICPLILWGAFLVTYTGSNWIATTLWGSIPGPEGGAA
jgi:hypothetical protein